MCRKTYKRRVRKHRRKERKKQRGGYLSTISKLSKYGMPMALAAYDAYKKQNKQTQKGGSNQSAIIAGRYSPGAWGSIYANKRLRNRLQYGYGIRNKYGIAPRKSFYIHK